MEEKQLRTRPVVAPHAGIASWLIARGFAKDDRHAEILMIAVTIVAGGIALFGFWAFDGGGLEATISDAKVQRINETMLPQ